MTETIRFARERDADFHTAEWGQLYSEIGENFRLSFQLTVYALIANGFIMAWVAQTSKEVFSPIVLEIAALIPILLTAFAFAFYRFLLWRSSIIYEYLSTIENSVAADGLGWENFYRKLSKQGRARGVGTIFHALFLIQFAAGLIFAVMVFMKYS